MIFQRLAAVEPKWKCVSNSDHSTLQFFLVCQSWAPLPKRMRHWKYCGNYDHYSIFYHYSIYIVRLMDGCLLQNVLLSCGQDILKPKGVAELATHKEKQNLQPFGSFLAWRTPSWIDCVPRDSFTPRNIRFIVVKSLGDWKLSLKAPLNLRLLPSAWFLRTHNGETLPAERVCTNDIGYRTEPKPQLNCQVHPVH